MTLRKVLIGAGIVLVLWIVANPGSHMPKLVGFLSAICGPLWSWLAH